MDNKLGQRQERRDAITKICSIWGAALILFAVVFFAPTLIAIKHIWYSLVYAFTVLIGLIAFIGVLRYKSLSLARTLFFISAIGTIPAIWVDPFTWGVFLIPACILLLFAAIRIKRKVVSTLTITPKLHKSQLSSF